MISETKYVFFKNDEIHKNAKLGLVITALFKEDNVKVMIDDLSKPTWYPDSGCNNPKVKYYSLEEFNKHFYIPNERTIKK